MTRGLVGYWDFDEQGSPLVFDKSGQGNDGMINDGGSGNPVSYWTFDEGTGQTAFDESLNNNDGRLGSTTAVDAGDPAWVEGKYGSALSFDGVNDYVDCGTRPSLEPGYGDYTIEAWIKAIQDRTSDRAIYYYYWGTVYNALRIILENGAVRYYVRTAPTNASWRDTLTAVDDNTWHHIVATWKGDIDTINLYLDGQENQGALTKAGTVGNIASGGNYYIGVDKIGAGGRWYFNGLIDDVRIYNYARTPAQILQDYNAGFSTHFK